ncbi:VirK family protein [Chitinimonas sp. PSY-7]|uniref:VirK family protein n=1 Tax=Chitinimonas sp. PSY-7 TaxID=3459088 RepID=UPI00403FD8D1
MSLISAANACDDASALAHYADVKATLLAGKQVTVLLDLAQCTVEASKDQSGPKVQSGYRINSFMIPGDTYIAFSDVHETLSPDEKLKTEHIRYRLTPDDKLTVRTSIVKDGVVTPRASFTCSLNAGARFVTGSGA